VDNQQCGYITQLEIKNPVDVANLFIYFSRNDKKNTPPPQKILFFRLFSFSEKKFAKL
jgi:hypothetical protein